METYYYTNRDLAENAAEALTCCGYVVKWSFDGTTYILTATRP